MAFYRSKIPAAKGRDLLLTDVQNDPVCLASAVHPRSADRQMVTMGFRFFIV